MRPEKAGPGAVPFKVFHIFRALCRWNEFYRKWNPPVLLALPVSAALLVWLRHVRRSCFASDVYKA